MTQKGPQHVDEIALSNASYIAELYQQWLLEPQSLSSDWQTFFKGISFTLKNGNLPASEAGKEQSRVNQLIHSFRSQGHLLAKTNPLQQPHKQNVPMLLAAFGLSQDDLNKEFNCSDIVGLEHANLKTVLKTLDLVYCQSIGAEYMHVQDAAQRKWLQEQLEQRIYKPTITREQREEILERLVDAELFEQFMQSRYPGQKRFSLEGAESLIPCVHALVEEAPVYEAQELVIGMAHRGRLNVLANILDKPYEVIFSEFEDIQYHDYFGGDGDVKYHKGFHSVHTNRNGEKLRISLTANPSHLEAVNPVAAGKTRAKQRRYNAEDKRKKVILLLIHGDAAFAGQGIVSETLNLSELEGYRVGGTIHIIVNNQIGFTATPEETRSSKYCTDVAKAIEAPILHVNGEDPEAVAEVAELALAFRQRFAKDILIDIICYRKYGHNEGDEPAFTQPLLYKAIKRRPSTRKMYMEKLQICCGFSNEQIQEKEQSFQVRLKESFEAVKRDSYFEDHDPQEPHYTKFAGPYSYESVPTQVDRNILQQIVKALTTIPEGFQLHGKIARQLPKKATQFNEEQLIDWGLAELLAFGTLLLEGIPVRLSGQDSARGTFTSRHAVWQDTRTNSSYIPLNAISQDQASLCVYNSSLSEAAVLGFDYGYSLEEPHMLVLWEAQFGDFANGAQVIIDQFIASGLSKWNRTAGITLLLPHGNEGQGPEHSNAYLERYLSLCAEDNMQVCNITTPAQYFHLLRRQMLRNFRRPLVIMSPKSLLRHPACVSTVDGLSQGQFHEFRPEYLKTKAEKIVLCSGKIYYDLIAKRTEQSLVHIIRVEQLYPLHIKAFQQILKPYDHLKEIYWVQEETQNRGAWNYMASHLRELYPDKTIHYIGRPQAASPASGSMRIHKQQQYKIVEQALS